MKETRTAAELEDIIRERMQMRALSASVYPTTPIGAWHANVYTRTPDGPDIQLRVLKLAEELATTFDLATKA